jgi:exodeoxyribonuclease VII small subunit
MDSETPIPQTHSVSDTSDLSVSDTTDLSDIDATDLSDIANLTYEQARDELISIVAQLEGGQIGLEDSMGLWQRGEALAIHCNTWLDGAEAQLTTSDEAKRTRSEQD